MEDVAMDTMLYWAPARRSTIGFDRFFGLLDAAVRSQDRPGYPPFNIEKTGEDAYRLIVAVAGWKPAEITVTAQPGLLVVSGRKPAIDGKRYLHRGIPSGSFEHRFALADDIEVREANLISGLLTVDLARVVAEAAAPHRITITDAVNSNQSLGKSELRLVRHTNAIRRSE
jgi:molecular chaperone IbpA